MRSTGWRRPPTSIVWPDEMPPPYEELRRRVADADGLICLLTDRIDAALIEAAPRLRVIANVAVGYDNIDVAAAAARGIAVGNTPGVLTETTADLAFALILATRAARRRGGALRARRALAHVGPEPAARRTTSTARRSASSASGRSARPWRAAPRGFDMRVLYTSRSDAGRCHAPARARVPLDELLRESDFVSMHVPLTTTRAR